MESITPAIEVAHRIIEITDKDRIIRIANDEMLLKKAINSMIRQTQMKDDIYSALESSPPELMTKLEKMFRIAWLIAEYEVSE